MGLTTLIILFSYICFASAVTIIPDDYNKAIRPAPKDGSPLEVSFSILVNGVQEINPEKMSIKIHMYLRVSWYDDRLVFPYEDAKQAPENNNTNTNMNIPKDLMSFTLNSKVLDSIWVPDHFFKATREVNHFQLLQDFKGFKLYSDLRIFTSSMVEIEVGCPMNFRSFPFDEQRCLVSLASYFYSSNEVSFKWHELGLSIDKAAGDQLGNYDVDLKQENSTRCECQECESLGEEPCLQFTVVLRRFDLNNLLGFYIPSALFTGVAWSSVFWPPEVIPGRTTLIITALLAVSNLYADSRQNSPKTSYVKALDAWMFYSIIASLLSLVQYAIILQWIKKQNASSSTSVKPTNPSSNFFYDKYKVYQEKTEQIGKYGLPVAFLLFNIIYWSYISSL